MRTYYLFEIKDIIIKNYKNNYKELYDVLSSIYRLKEDDLLLGADIFNRVANRINKDKINKYIKDNNINSECYICYNGNHLINDYLNNESTKMSVNNSHIKIKTNKNAPSFFYNIRNFDNIFVCDFDNDDYFLLRDTIYNSCISV